MNAPGQAKKVLAVRFSADDCERLGRVALHYGLTASAAVRFLVKRESDALAKSTSKKRFKR